MSVLADTDVTTRAPATLASALAILLTRVNAPVNTITFPYHLKTYMYKP